MAVSDYAWLENTFLKPRDMASARPLISVYWEERWEMSAEELETELWCGSRPL
jgi:ubiquinone biosynthesis protein Coq4